MCDLSKKYQLWSPGGQAGLFLARCTAVSSADMGEHNIVRFKASTITMEHAALPTCFVFCVQTDICEYTTNKMCMQKLYKSPL